MEKILKPGVVVFDKRTDEEKLQDLEDMYRKHISDQWLYSFFTT